MADRIHTSGPVAMVVAGLLIGMEMLIMPFTPVLLIAGLLAIVFTLVIRWASGWGSRSVHEDIRVIQSRRSQSSPGTVCGGI